MAHSWEVLGIPYAHSYFAHVGSRLTYCWLVPSLNELIIHNPWRLSQGMWDSPVWFLPLTFAASSGCYIFLAPLLFSKSPFHSGLGHLTALVCHSVPCHFWHTGACNPAAGCALLSQPHAPGDLTSQHVPKCHRLLQNGQVSSTGIGDLWGFWTIKPTFFKTPCPTKGAERIYFDRMLLQQNSKSKLLQYL